MLPHLPEGGCPVIDHLGGSDRRHPDPAVWRTLPAKILPVCGTAGRCGNQRSEASSRLRCSRCLPFAGVAANMCSSQKAGRKSQGRYGNAESGADVCPPPAPPGVFTFTGVFARMCSSQKTGRRTRGRCENTEIRSGSLSIACPVQGVRFYKRTCRMRFSAQKNPPAGKPGDFYQAFAVRWVFSRAITTGGISTS